MSEAVDKLRNVALVGHGSAGKTSLAETMLYNGGVANRIGREVAAALALAYLLARCQEGIGKGAALLLGLAQ